jgi:methyltransferase (TIGR00027 family)
MTHSPRPSRTALITCLMRAVHTRYDRPALIDDPWADRLVTPDEREEFAAAVLAAAPAADQRDRLRSLGHPDAILHAAWHPTAVYGGVVLRSRYTEDHLATAAARARGVRQYVLLGAGFDSFGVRRPDFARDLHVFEVDHPTSQDLKRARLAASGTPLPPTLHFVPADLAGEDLADALARSPYRFDEPAILSWLGVTVYLTRDANLATLRSVARLAAPGSELIFTYIEQRALESDSPAMRRALAYAAAIGEPWLSGFDPATLPADLHALGLTLVEDLAPADLHRLYLTNRTDALTPGRAGRIARARVTDDCR